MVGDVETDGVEAMLSGMTDDAVNERDFMESEALVDGDVVRVATVVAVGSREDFVS